MSYQPFLEYTPESVGISSRNLLRMVKKLEASGTEMHGIMLWRHGRVILKGWWDPYTNSTAHICHSFGKSYVATALGAACTDGYLSVEDRVIDFFPEEVEKLNLDTSGNLGKLKVKHVLTMSNGMSVHAKAGENLVRNYLTTDVDLEPGSVFKYNTSGSCMLGEIVRRVTGKSVLDYLWTRVLNPIGCKKESFRWMTFNNGLHAAPGVASGTENNLRLGILYLQNGVWNGERIIDEGWMNEATHKLIDNKEWGYGYQLWIYRTPDTFRFSGGHGQDCFMCRPNDLVLSINQAASEPHDNFTCFDTVDPVLFTPNLPDSLPDDPEAYEELCRYMASRRLPSAGTHALHGTCEKWEGVYRLVEGGFHIQPELCPFGDDNVNSDFYTMNDIEVKTMQIKKTDEGLDLILNGKDIIHARTDGQWIPHHLQSAMPAYDQSCAVADSDGERLIVTQWFLQTCFKSRLTMRQSGTKLLVEVRKERLHDETPYLWRNAAMVKELE